jgi:hypothetical protein
MLLQECNFTCFVIIIENRLTTHTSYQSFYFIEDRLFIKNIICICIGIFWIFLDVCKTICIESGAVRPAIMQAEHTSYCPWPPLGLGSNFNSLHCLTKNPRRGGMKDNCLHNELEVGSLKGRF